MNFFSGMKSLKRQAAAIAIAGSLGMCLPGALAVSAEDVTDLQKVTEQEIARARLEKQERQRRADFHVKQGNDYLKAGRYREAMEQFTVARGLDPENKGAKAGRKESLRYLETRTKNSGSISSAINRARVRDEYNKAEMRQYLSQANKYYAKAAAPLATGNADIMSKDLANKMKLLKSSEDAAVRANMRIQGFGSDSGTQQSKVAIAQLIKDIRSLRENLLMQQQKINREKALTDIKKEQDRVESIEENRRAYLIKQAKDYMAKKEYEEAASIIKQMLRDDPVNQQLKDMKELNRKLDLSNRDKIINDMVRENRLKNLEDIQAKAISRVHPNNPIRYPDDWNKMVRRKKLAAGGGKTLTVAAQATRRKLDKSFTFQFVETDLQLILDTIRKGTGINVIVNKTVKEAGTLDETFSFYFRDMRLENILNWVANRSGLKYAIDDNGIVKISSATESDSEMEVMVYDIRDIAFAVTNAGTMPTDDDDDDDDDDDEGPDDTITLGDILKNFVTSTGGQPADIQIESGGRLLVKGDKQTRMQIEKLLGQLRSAQTIQVSVSARFLTVTDNFWEQFRSEFVDYTTQQVSNTTNNKYIVGGSAGMLGNGQGMNPTIVNGGAPTGVPSLQPTGGSSATNYLDPMYANPLFNPGTYWSELAGTFQYGTFTGLSSVFGAGKPGGADVGGLNFAIQELGYLGSLQAQWFIQMIRETSRSDELFSPHLVVYNNRYGWIRFVERIPYVGNLVAGDGDSGMQYVINYIDAGSSLEVRPMVSSDKKYITVDARPRVTKVMSINQAAISGYVYTGSVIIDNGTIQPLEEGTFDYVIDLPVRFRHDAKTYATIPDGGAILMSGLSTNTNGRGRSGVPILQDLPLLGNAFSSRYTQKDRESYVCLLNAKMILLDEEEAKAR